jgi:hypothetical protein
MWFDYGLYIAGWIIGGILVGFAGLNRKGGFGRAFLLGLLLSPLFGLIFTIGGARRNPRGCNHCGNEANEVEFCGLCGKNEEGKTRKAFEKENHNT